jgi:WD40 repeat protein
LRLTIVDILVAYQLIPEGSDSGILFTVDSNLVSHVWSGQPADLMTFRSAVELVSDYEIEIFSGRLNFKGLVKLFFGYRLSDGRRVYNGTRPILINRSGNPYVSALAIDPQGLRVASGGSGNTGRVWDFATSDTLVLLNGHNANINALAFSPNGSDVASAGSDSRVIVWDTTTGMVDAEYGGHAYGFTAVAFNPSVGNEVASGSRDKTVHIWDPQSGQLPRYLKDLTTTCEAEVGCSCDVYAACSCDTVCSCDTYVPCSCDAVCTCDTVCSCVSVCTCLTVSHYWYPN